MSLPRLGPLPTHVYGVQHEVCGHMVGISRSEQNTLDVVELLVAAGYLRFRSVSIPLEDAPRVLAEAQSVVRPGGCQTCRIDPSRGGMERVHQVAGQHEAAGRGRFPW